MRLMKFRDIVFISALEKILKSFCQWGDMRYTTVGVGKNIL